MAEESIDDFLKEVATERKPLSEEERREAMRIVLQVREIAIKKSEGGEVIDFVNRYPDYQQEISIHLDKEDIEMLKPKNPQTELAVITQKKATDKNGKVVFREDKLYFFAPDEVIVVEFGMKDIKLGFTNPANLDQAMRTVEQMTQEEYHPGKTDLNNLLSDLSSAEPMTY